MKLSMELLEALQECIAIINRLLGLLDEDREDMSGCISGEILEEYLLGTADAREITVSLLESLREILANQ